MLSKYLTTGLIIERAFTTFKKQSEIDYFIHKDAGAFLREQFNFWIKGYLMDDETVFDVGRLAQLKALKEIAFLIINVVAQFEDELVKIWNKPKFVKNSNYVITLDRIAERNTDLMETILKHPNIKQQVEEWQALGMIDDTFTTDLTTNQNNELFENGYLNPNYKFLPLDTKYFKDLELDILALFENLDEALDGWLIHSENYQALNTIKEKFNEKIQIGYIDPPYNTGNDEFIYNDNYQHSSWLTFINDRVALSHQLIKNEGANFVHIDYKELSNLRIILETKFGKNNFVQLISIKTASPTGFKTVNPGPIDVTEYLLFLTKDKKNFNFKKMYTKVDYDSNYNLFITNPNDDAKDWKLISIIDAFYKSINIENNKEAMKQYGENWKTIRDILIAEFAFKNRNVLVSKRDPHKPTDKVKQHLKKSKQVDHIIEVKRGKVESMYIYKGGSLSFYSKKVKDIFGELTPTELLTDFWNDLSWAGIANEGHVKLKNGKKPEKLLGRIIEMSSEERDIVCDYFLGSATTTAVAHKMNRKWLGIEMGEHFEIIGLKRMKYVLFGDQTGISKSLNYAGGGFFKYYQLEQYEEALQKVKYEDKPPLASNSLFHQYIFLKDSKLSEALSVEEDKIKTDLSKLYPGIDIAETLSNLTGKAIKQIKEDSVIFEDDTIVNTAELDYKLIKPLIWW